MNAPVATNRVNSQPSVAAAVVLYNSSPDCVTNLKSYLSQVQKLYIIDNSPAPTSWIADEFGANPAVIFQHFPQNVGIATALNTAARLAIADGFTYLLTMDDDSRAPAGMISTMLDYLAAAKPGTIGIVTPRHTLSTAANYQPQSQQPRPVLTTMTSGNLLDLRIYEQVGPFCDALFIDVVDHDYDLRLYQAGYQIIELPNLSLVHRLGTQKRVWFTKLTYVSHSPVRNYYLVRNSLIVAIRNRRHYPAYWLTALLTISIELAKAALFEDERLLRLRLITKAIGNGTRARLGKLK